jgi:predicted nucleotidyltransferase
MARLQSAELPADLDLVVLFGSRAKGRAISGSDWDLGVRFGPGSAASPADPMRLYRLDWELAAALGCSSDAVDVVDLDQASYLLQRVVAEDGQPLFERRPGLFGSFCSRAIRQWADWQRRQQKLAAERRQVGA